MFNFASGVVHAALTRPRGADGTVGSGKDSASPAGGAALSWFRSSSLGAEESFPPQNKDFANSSFRSGRDSASPKSGRDSASPKSGRDSASPKSGRDSASPKIGCSILRAALFMPLLHVREARTVRWGAEGIPHPQLVWRLSGPDNGRHSTGAAENGRDRTPGDPRERREQRGVLLGGGR